MSTRNHIDVVRVVEFVHDIPTEEISSATRADRPATNFVRVTPHQITHRPVVGNLLLAVESADLIKGVDRGRETTVDAENLVINDCSQCQIVEDLSAVAPNINRTVLSKALIVKAVDLGDLTRLVVSSDEGNSLGVSHFEGKEQQERFNGRITSVDEISHEEVVRVRALSSDLE